MPAIKKLQETWTSSSITTVFRLCAKDDIASSLPLQSPLAGFSWCLTLRRAGQKKPGSLICQLFFYSPNCPSAWCGAPINVTLSFPSRPDGNLADTTPTALVLGVGLNKSLTTCSADNLGDALVSLEVTFTDLRTCNLFDVLENFGRVPDAPASAKEPKVPQAYTGRRALEQSLKTGTSLDVIFQAYARRSSPGKVMRPVSVYANTAVLQATMPLPDFCMFYSQSSSWLLSSVSNRLGRP